MFDKPSGNMKWSEELFKIHDIDISDVIMYRLKDMNDEIIEGSFYEKELQKTKNTTTTTRYKGRSPPIFGVASGAYLLFINPKPLRTKALY